MPRVKDFEARATDRTFRLSDHAGHPVVLYFYPKDNTPGCTTEGMQFRDLYPQFAKIGAVVAGISRDSLASHANFKSRMDFPFPLLSDADEALCAQFDVIKMKNMYGRKVRGIERSTFVIDKSGTLSREWRKVRVPWHAQQVIYFRPPLCRRSVLLRFPPPP